MDHPEDVSSLEKIIQLEEAETVLNVVRSLSVKLRSVVVLYYYDSFTVKEIAGILKITEGTVKSRLHAARKQMQSVLKDSEEAAVRTSSQIYYASRQ